MELPETLHFFDRYDRFGSSGDAVRSRYRYDAIISCNYELFHDARVLNLYSGDGRWCMAALDAGAAHVIGVEPSRRAVEAARSVFIEYGTTPESYQFIESDVNAALKTTAAGLFDLIVCPQAFELSDPRVFFGHLYRLAPKHVILDTLVSRGEGPIMRFDLKLRDATAPKGTRQHGAIIAAPNHELIVFLCEYFRFGWRLIDWQALGIADWTGIHDYERGRRRTYVLDRQVD
jgi:Methyltransferase domain